MLIIGLALLNKTPKSTSLDAAVQGAAVEESTTTTEEYWQEDSATVTE